MSTPTTSAYSMRCDTSQEDTPLAAGVDSIGGGGLLDRFYCGAVPYKPKAILIGNDGSRTLVPEGSYLVGNRDSEILPMTRDHGRMIKWLGCASRWLKTTAKVENSVDRATIVVNGHVDMTSNGRVYSSLSGGSEPSSGIPLVDMGRWLTEKEESMDLVFITDVILLLHELSRQLPYVGERKDDGTWYWQETGTCSDPGQWDDKRILHFASTSEGESAHEFPSTGGIYTREFYNVAPRDDNVTFGQRLDLIQAGMDKFFDQWASSRGVRLEQHHRVYSSHKLDFADRSIFKTRGLY
ncbi:hypothetical protein FRC07_000314 [Ceratobasidium sp. 392]|nr:hypothetical protein FRC07_000314 [Ceratobasidium sp. 392]